MIIEYNEDGVILNVEFFYNNEDADFEVLAITLNGNDINIMDIIISHSTVWPDIDKYIKANAEKWRQEETADYEVFYGSI